MTFGSCDGYFRALEEVKLRIGRPEAIFPNRRRLQEEDTVELLILNGTNSTNATNTTLTTNSTNTTNTTSDGFYQVETYVGSTLFSVAGSCRNCPVSEAGYFNVGLFCGVVGHVIAYLASVAHLFALDF